MTLDQAYRLGFQKAAEYYEAKIQKRAARRDALRKAAQQQFMGTPRNSARVPYDKLPPARQKIERRKFFPSILSYLNPGNHIALGSARFDAQAPAAPVANVATNTPAVR